MLKLGTHTLYNILLKKYKYTVVILFSEFHFNYYVIYIFIYIYISLIKYYNAYGYLLQTYIT